MGAPKYLVVTASLLILFACSESSILLGGLDEESRVSVTLTAPGAMVESGDEVAITIERQASARSDDGVPDSVLIELLDYDGVVLATQRYNSVETASTLPSVPIPNLEPGLYRLVAAYSEGDEIISTTEIPLFLVSETYRIRGLTSFPASSFPEADSLLSLSLDIPLASDPYLVWYVNGDVAAAGYLSQTGTTLAIAAPDLQGVFPVRVDLYPAWHGSADPAELTAPVRYTSEIFVSDDPTVLPSDLGPDERYFMLYHMRGTLRESGARTDLFPQTDFDASRFGAVELAARDRFFGYAFDGRSGVAIPGYFWPVYERRFSPVSLAFRLLPSATGVAQTLLESELAGQAGVAVLIAADGRVGISTGAGVESVWSELPIIQGDTIVDLTVSMVPDDGELVVHFYADGLPVSTARVPFDTAPPLSAAIEAGGESAWSMMRGETRLGSNSNGYIGTIDEFGVFFVNADGVPAADNSVFYESLAARYGDSLIVAESFVAEPSVSGLALTGASDIGDAYLILGDGGRLSLPEVNLRRGRVRLEIDTSGDAELWLGLGGDERAGSSYSVPVGETAVVIVRSTDDGVELTFGDDDPVLVAEADGEAPLLLSLQASGEELVLNSIVMRYVDDPRADSLAGTTGQ